MPVNTRNQCLTSVAHRIVDRDAINPQAQSPLFRAPPEVRYMIFEMALKIEEDSDKPYDMINDQRRPGDSCKRTNTTALLLACSQVYFETYRVIMNTNEHVFWIPKVPALIMRPEYSLQYFTKKTFTMQQIKDISSIHLHLNTHALQTDILTRLSPMKDAKHLRIIIGMQKWDTGLFRTFSYHLWDVVAANAHHRPTSPVPLPFSMDLRIKKEVDMERMNKLIELGDQVQVESGSFAHGFRNFSSLETFTLEFDTIAGARPSLQKLIDHASTWVFPMKLKGRGKERVEKEMRVLDPVEEEEWEALDEQQAHKWRCAFGPNADRAVTMRLKWVVVPKEKERVAEAAAA